MTTEEYAMTTEGGETHPVRKRRAVLSLTGDLIGIAHRIIIESDEK